MIREQIDETAAAGAMPLAAAGLTRPAGQAPGSFGLKIVGHRIGRRPAPRPEAARPGRTRRTATG